MVSVIAVICCLRLKSDLRNKNSDDHWGVRDDSNCQKHSHDLQWTTSGIGRIWKKMTKGHYCARKNEPWFSTSSVFCFFSEDHHFSEHTDRELFSSKKCFEQKRAFAFHKILHHFSHYSAQRKLSNTELFLLTISGFVLDHLQHNLPDNDKIQPDGNENSNMARYRWLYQAVSRAQAHRHNWKRFLTLFWESSGRIERQGSLLSSVRFANFYPTQIVPRRAYCCCETCRPHHISSDFSSLIGYFQKKVDFLKLLLVLRCWYGF